VGGGKEEREGEEGGRESSEALKGKAAASWEITAAGGLAVTTKDGINQGWGSLTDMSRCGVTCGKSGGKQGGSTLGRTGKKGEGGGGRERGGEGGRTGGL